MFKFNSVLNILCKCPSNLYCTLKSLSRHSGRVWQGSCSLGSFLNFQSDVGCCLGLNHLKTQMDQTAKMAHSHCYQVMWLSFGNAHMWHLQPVIFRIVRFLTWWMVFPRVSKEVQVEVAWLFLTSEVTYYYFCCIPLVKVVMSLPRFKGREYRPHFLVEGLSENFEPMF